MLSGIILQPGGWDACEGPLEDVLISGITMRNVASPVTILLKRSGNTADNITIANLTATGVYRAAASVESWTDTPCGRVVLRDASIEYTGGGTDGQARQPAREPGVDCRSLPVWGLYARNARDVVVQNVRLYTAGKDLRPAVVAENVENLTLDAVRFPADQDAVRLENVRTIDARDTANVSPRQAKKQ
ncbi:MAG TPA: hypothetical protein ENN81_06580 [Phycisphaerales bacterium]|nr:hypothetical protein [Phycisphaerales bacterium]